MINIKTILIAGKAQAGKDYTASILQNHYADQNKKIVIMHYADLLKFYCKQYFGWNGLKDEKGRSLLQYVGTDIVRNKDVNYWVEHINKFLEIFENEFDYIIIADCRFPNELDNINSKFNPIKIKIERDGYDNLLNDTQKSHLSETALDDYDDYDLILKNTGDETYDSMVISKTERIFQ